MMTSQSIHAHHHGPTREVPSARKFRDVVGQFATGVTVVTVASEGQVRGMTANAFTAVSLDPLVVLVCLRLGCATDELVSSTDHFAVSILSSEQQSVAAWFANPSRPSGRQQLDTVGWRPGRATGTPLVDHALAWLECAVQERVVVGDHAVVYGRVLDLGCSGSGAPLVFHQGKFETLADEREQLAAS
jgi:flavin reductase (DIM6/NTAB) family NADH-FMN oxidoreductase RutF